MNGTGLETVQTVVGRPPDTLQELVSVQTLSRLLDVKEKTIREWVLKRKIPYHKLGKLVRFHLSEIRAWYQAQKMEILTPEIIRDKII